MQQKKSYKLQNPKKQKEYNKTSKPVQINNNYKFLCFKPKVVNLITASDRPCLEYPQLWSHSKKKMTEIRLFSWICTKIPSPSCILKYPRELQFSLGLRSPKFSNSLGYFLITSGGGNICTNFPKKLDFPQQNYQSLN